MMSGASVIDVDPGSLPARLLQEDLFKPSVRYGSGLNVIIGANIECSRSNTESAPVRMAAAEALAQQFEAVARDAVGCVMTTPVAGWLVSHAGGDGRAIVNEKDHPLAEDGQSSTVLSQTIKSAGKVADRFWPAIKNADFRDLVMLAGNQSARIYAAVGAILCCAALYDTEGTGDWSAPIPPVSLVRLSHAGEALGVAAAVRSIETPHAKIWRDRVYKLIEGIRALVDYYEQPKLVFDRTLTPEELASPAVELSLDIGFTLIQLVVAGYDPSPGANTGGSGQPSRKDSGSTSSVAGATILFLPQQRGQ